MTDRTLPSAHRWATEVPPEHFCFADLDAYLFQRHPEVLKSLGRYPSDHQSSPQGSVDPTLGCLAGLIGLIVFAAPVAGMTAFLTGGDTEFGTTDGFSTSTAMTIAQVCFWIAPLGPLMAAGSWWKHGRRWQSGNYGVCASAIGFGLLTALIMWRRGTADGVAWAEAILPVWITVGVAAVVALVMALFSRGRQIDRIVDFPVYGPPDDAAVARQIATLSPRQARLMTDARRAALDALVEREVISGSQWQRADLAPLGRLHQLDD